MRFIVAFGFISAAIVLRSPVNAQRIKLTNQTNQKVIYLERGMRAWFVIRSERSGDYKQFMSTFPNGIATITGISSDSIRVDRFSIALADLRAIGRKKKGSGFGQYVFGFMGTALIINAFKKPYDPCPTCQTVGPSPDNSAQVLWGVAGAGLIVLGITSAIRNSPRDLAKWKLEVMTP